VGALGSVLNGGPWLIFDGQPVDWLFRDLARIRAVVAECRAGRPEVVYQPGHPHAFVSAIYLGELDACVPLQDPSDTIASLRGLVRPYPPLLREALVARFLFAADFSLDGAVKALARGDVVYVAGALYRSIAALVQVLYAAHERYCLNEKGAVAEIASLPGTPPGFVETARHVLSAVGASSQALTANV